MENRKIIYFSFITKEGDCMSNILEELSGKTAPELLKQYNISTVPPINISLLLQRIGILEIPYDFSEVENAMGYSHGDVLGATFATENKVGIFYRSSDTLNRKRFTLAHEIAHCCLHKDSLERKHIELRSCQTENNGKERDANIFAGELLIPTSSLRKIHSQLLVAPSLSDLSKIFAVSTNVMAARLDYLNLSYIKDDIIAED